MPISLVDDDGNALDLDKADGGTLRKKLEEAIAENRKLAQRVATGEAKELISSKGYNLVKPEDLADVPLDQIEVKAKELHEQRLESRKETIREVLADRHGLEGAELDAAVEDFLGGGGVANEGTVIEDKDLGLDDLASLPGSRPNLSPKLPPMSDAFGNLESHFEAQERRRK